MLHYWYICDVWDEWDAHIEPVSGNTLPRLSSSTTQQIHNAKCKHNTYVDLQFSLKWIKFFKNLISETESNYLLASATGAMPETKTQKQIKTKHKSNETQISKSLNLKSKSKPISFQPINKEKEIAWERERERTNLLVESDSSPQRKMMDEGGHRREREGYWREGNGVG